MRDENTKKSKLSWSKNLVRRWFTIKNKEQNFHADESGVDGGEWSSRFSARRSCTVKRSISGGLSDKGSVGIRQPKFDRDSAQITDIIDYRIFVSTWNVGGKPPPDNLNLEDWLQSSPPADIYVLGFQEIVPLNAGNVLGAEDNGPSKKWVTLIRKTLNNLQGTSASERYNMPSPVFDPIAELHSDFESSSSQHKATSFFHRHSFQSLSHSLRIEGDIMVPQCNPYHRFSLCDRGMLGSMLSDFDPNYRCGGSSDDEYAGGDSPVTSSYSPVSYERGTSLSMVDGKNLEWHSRYCLVASKQMVGIFLTVWVRSEIKDEVRNLKVSCVGRGLMGYLGNKGSISISMLVHQTSFCFICCHLTSGQKEGDELRRNSDVTEILRKTRFPRVHGLEDERPLESILEHDRIIWLGDLNYRIALSYCTARALVEMHNWKALLENDQLRIEQHSGRVFGGWKEGRIFFPPTYKYSTNSDRYAGQSMRVKEKRRTPAWCDRILWYGNGINQLAYVCGESRLSDHRPVYSIFTAEVQKINSQINMCCSCSRIEVEELLPYVHPLTELGSF